MSQARSYLDWNATSPLRPEAAAAISDALARAGNPSSVHAEGRAARAILERARDSVAFLVGAPGANVVFTGSGTEANVTALCPEIVVDGDAVRVDTLFVSAIEHPSVLSGGRFAAERVRRIPVDGEGLVDIDWLARELVLEMAEGRRSLVSVMLANNETGVVEDVAEIARVARAAGAFSHCDAVQAAARMPVAIGMLGVDFLTLSGHKIGAPAGVGALVLGSPDVAPAPLLVGGGQELRRRAGTENVAGIAGFGAAAEAAREAVLHAPAIAALRDRIAAGIAAITPDAVVFSAGAGRLANTLCFAAAGLRAETAVIAFDLEGVALSSGSACSSGKVAASHVLAAMGVPADLARAALRVSIGATTDEADVERFLDAWKKISARRRPIDETLGQDRPAAGRAA